MKETEYRFVFAAAADIPEISLSMASRRRLMCSRLSAACESCQSSFIIMILMSRANNNCFMQRKIQSKLNIKSRLGHVENRDELFSPFDTCRGKSTERKFSSTTPEGIKSTLKQEN